MLVATGLVSTVLAVLVSFAAIRKLSHRPDVVASYARVGVPEDRLNHLAAILLAGAAGLTLGLLWAPVGAAAAAGLVVYFLLAVLAHLRAADLGNAPTPAVIELLAIAALILRIQTL